MADPGLPAIPYDPEAAKKLLFTAGFRPDKDGVLKRDGRRFEINIWSSSGNKPRERHLQAVARDWKAVGVIAHLKVGPNS
jgi:peptide/nickel transport system substrate-binding protein